MKRILYLAHYHAIGGAENSLLLLLKHLDKSIYEPIIVLPRAGPFAEELVNSGFKIAIIRAHMFYWPVPIWKAILKCMIMLIETPYVIMKLLLLIRGEEIQLIHVNSLANLYGWIAAKISNRPLVWHIRDIYGGITIKWLGPLVRYTADHVIFITNSVKRAIGVEIPNSSVIYNGVPIIRMEAILMSDPRVYKERSPLICTLSKLEPWKGQDDVIRAVAKLVPKYTNMKCVMAGDDPSQGKSYLTYLKRLVKELAVEDYIEFIGFQKDVVSVLQNKDAMVLASWEEPFGRVLIEAMESGIPVVATSGGGVPEIIDDGLTGLLFTPRNFLGLAEQLDRLFQDEELHRTLRIHAKEKVRNKFSVEQYADNIQEVYKEIFSKGYGRRRLHENTVSQS